MKENLQEQIDRVRKLMNLSESDISGIDELVYNPVTKKGGAIGHGYDRGKKVEGITWKGHDNHLHVGFTNRDVAMKVIDKADSMGLRTTENPYAKKDPNGKVDYVHVDGSFHYKTFKGDPKVGAGVDISGSDEKIIELIKWIESEYATSTVSYPDTETDTESDTSSETDENDAEKLLEKILDSKFMGEKVKDQLDKMGANFFELLFKAAEALRGIE